MLNVFRTKIASKRSIKQLNVFNWLSNVKNLVLSNGSEHVRNVIQFDVIQCIKIAFFFQKIAKKRPQSFRRLGALPSEPRLWYVWVTQVFSARLQS